MCQVGFQVLQFQVGTSGTEQQLHLSTNAQMVVQLARVSKSHLGIGHSVGRDVAYVVGLVARVLSKLEQLIGKHHAKGRAHAHLEGVVTTEPLETCRQQGNVDIACEAVIACAEAL